MRFFRIRAVPVRLVPVLNNKGGKYLPGTYVRVQLDFGQGSIVGMPVPSESVTLDANGAYVFIVQNGKAKKVDIKTGLRTPITVDVVKGLSAGDTVIASGLMSVREEWNIEQRRTHEQYELRGERMSFSTLSIRRPVLVTVFSLGIVLIGAFGASNLGIREYPNVDSPVITVRTTYTGANASVVETEVTEKSLKLRRQLLRALNL